MNVKWAVNTVTVTAITAMLLFPWRVEAPATPDEVTPPATDSPAQIMEQYGCWSGDAPPDMAGVVPGHVVIRYGGQGSATYRGSRAVDHALTYIFDGDHTNNVEQVYGFCR